MQQIVVSSVVPPLDGALEQLGHDYFDVVPLFVTPGLVHDMPVLYEPATDVGSDRIVNAVAAREMYGAPVIVVDSARRPRSTSSMPTVRTPVDRSHPASPLLADALYERAARLPRVDIARPARVIGGNTVESMQSGIYFGYADLVNGLVQRLRESLGGHRR